MSRPPADKTLVIIPTYNEAQNLEHIVTRVLEANPGVHVLVADDNSPDGTGDIADGLAARLPGVHVMHRQGKQGLGAAYLAGFDWGLARGYEALVEMDADGSHKPEQLHRLLDALAGADMVKGSRYVRGGSVVNWPKSREILSRGGGLWTRLMLGLRVADPTGGFNAMRAEALRAIDLSGVESAGYCFQIDLTWRMTKAGRKVVEVPIDFVEREFGESKMDRSIVVEALTRTARWGVRHRARQLGGAAAKLERGARRLLRGRRRG